MIANLVLVASPRRGSSACWRSPRRRSSAPSRRSSACWLSNPWASCTKENGKHEFAVAELSVFKSITSKFYADICLLRSNTSADPVLDGKWKSMRLEILDIKSSDPWQLCCWQTDTVIPFNRSLCWIDYNRGILSCDVFGEPTPSISFIAFPLDEFPCAHAHHQINSSSWLYRGVCAINDGGELKFVKVTRHDGICYGELEPGSGFTITCHTLLSGSIQWTLDYKITSAELWSTNPPKHLPHTILMCPQVNIDRPQVVHFLISEFKYVVKKMWVVTIDMSTKTVESLIPYINGKEGLKTDDADLTIRRSSAPMSFLPCEFSRFLHLSSPPIKNDEACSTNAWKLKEGVHNN